MQNTAALTISTLPQPTWLLVAFLLAVLVSAAAYYFHSLTPSGAIAAAIIGTLTFGFGGWSGAILLLAFFISSSLLSRLFGRRKHTLAEKFSKGARRDASQVFANGGLAALFASLHSFFPDQGWVWAGMVGSLAAVNADTWATELGVLSRTPPRLVTTGQSVERGTSGGVSLVGSLAALAGAGLIALLAVLLAGNAWRALPALALFCVAGVAGSFFDSFLGATIQSIYYCPACKKETERHPFHTCGTATTPLRGWIWLNNDWVNVLCALAGLGLAAGFWFVSPGWFASATSPLTPSGEIPMSFPLSSTSFDMGSTISQKYTCDGANRSPSFTWKDLPQGTRSLALIADDPDAPGGTFTHWVLYNIPPSLSIIAEAQPQTPILPNIGTQGTNDFRHSGYDGPCPPPGPAHRYYFRLYALDIAPTLPENLKAADLRKAIQGHVLGDAQWVGRYSR